MKSNNNENGNTNEFIRWKGGFSVQSFKYLLNVLFFATIKNYDARNDEEKKVTDS